MKQVSILILALLMSTASSALTALRPLADSDAWAPHCECLNTEQLYFAKHF
jgi:hypothetical protein